MDCASEQITRHELRALIARENLFKYHVAIRAGMHPQRLGNILAGRIPLTSALAERIVRAVEDLSPA